MRAEKQIITTEYVTPAWTARRSSSWSPIQGLKVGHFTELRKRLQHAGAEVHVVKNSIFRIAAKEAGVAELNGSLVGQLAVVTGKKDVSVTSKVLKSFGAEFDKLKIKFGYLNSKRIEEADIVALADLPSLDVLRGKLLGVLIAPATKLVVLLNTPATQLARVLQATADKGE